MYTSGYRCLMLFYGQRRFRQKLGSNKMNGMHHSHQYRGIEQSGAKHQHDSLTLLDELFQNKTCNCHSAHSISSIFAKASASALTQQHVLQKQQGVLLLT